MATIRVVVGGSKGRMSQCISECIQADPEFSLITQTSHQQGGLAAVKMPFDVFIDFTHADAVLEHLTLCRQHQQRMVIGVTGLSASVREAIAQAAKQIPIVLSSNMSIGANISFKLLEMAAQSLGEVEVAIQETHHKNKKDAPSGTALKMGEIIASTWGKSLDKSNIGFASSRIGEVMGDHHVLFALPGEQLEITHKAADRKIFARGAVSAAKWLMQQPPGLYDMQDVLGLKPIKG